MSGYPNWELKLDSTGYTRFRPDDEIVLKKVEGTQKDHGLMRMGTLQLTSLKKVLKSILQDFVTLLVDINLRSRPKTKIRSSIIVFHTPR